MGFLKQFEVEIRGERRIYNLYPTKMYRVLRYSANAYWEDKETFQSRGPAPIEEEANFSLAEVSPKVQNVHYFASEEDVKLFFKFLRATVISETDAL